MRKHRKTPLLFLTPFLTVFVAFYLAPVLYAVYLSLFVRKRVGLGPARDMFGGLANYVRAVQDMDFLSGLKNMFVFGIVQVPIMLGVAIALALLLDQSKGLFGKLCRTVFFMPYAIPTAIGALIWGYMVLAKPFALQPGLRDAPSGTNRLPFAGPGPVLDREHRDLDMDRLQHGDAVCCLAGDPERSLRSGERRWGHGMGRGALY